ncbi:hypothetical protein [Acinetobacter sp. ANC 3813]|uniref:hypothetical protein n=1 Tax=Acinetobacter sp. ANC 3813 TaxID=1977873 RepID=UPI000A34871E|nr:hypothetical protein [Acinetobacter sp. ANC 3813]OTG88891.1 hypothetical protein B9T34_14100 [Acinetobacter sp. ANC 3813]
MSEYTPPDALNVILNFKKESQTLDSHNLILNFGAEDGFSFANISINTAINFKASGKVEQPVDVHGHADIQINCSFDVAAAGTFDINHILGISTSINSAFQKAIPCIHVNEIPWEKPILRAHNSAFFIERGKPVSAARKIRFEKGRLLAAAIQSIHEDATGLASTIHIDWNENKRLRVTQSSVFEQADKLYIERAFDWMELVRKRKQFTYSHEVAHVFEKRFSFEWDKGLQITTDTVLPWDKAKAIHYRKHAVEPWPEPQLPVYAGSTDLNFICLCHEVDPHNVVLNFGADDCIPAIPNQKGWYILNTVNVVRLDTGQSIKVYDGRYSTSRDNWCWGYSLTVPPTEISKLESDGKPVILQITVNGNVHHMLYESKSVSRQFAKETWTLKGRSQSALLSADYSPLRSFLQENERTSVQLCQAEIDRANSSTLLDWQLIDELGWIVENESLTYTNLAPIDAIKMVVEAGGGFIYSERAGNQISIKPKYKKSAWNSMSINDYDKLLPESLVFDQSIDEVELDDFNGITLTNAKNGNTYQVKRTGTAGDVLKETVSNAMFDAVSAGGYAKAELSRFGKVEDHSFTTPINAQFNECTPGQTLAFNGSWWGIVDAVDVSFSHKEVKQTVKVERVLNEQ